MKKRTQTQNYKKSITTPKQLKKAVPQSIKNQIRIKPTHRKKVASVGQTKIIQAPKIIWRDKKPIIKTVIKKVLDTKLIQKLTKEKTELQNTVIALKKQSLNNKPKPNVQPNTQVTLLKAEVNKLRLAFNKKGNQNTTIDKAVEALKQEQQRINERKAKEEKIYKEEILKMLSQQVNKKPVRKKPYKLVTLSQPQKEFMHEYIIVPLDAKLKNIEDTPQYKQFNPAKEMPGYYIHFSNLYKQILQGREPELVKHYVKAQMYDHKEPPAVAYIKLKTYMFNNCPNLKTDYATTRASTTSKNK